MRIIRVQNPVGIDYMKEHFISNIESDFLAEGLKAELLTDRENILILQAWNEDKLIGFIIAQNVVQQNHIFLYQAWVPNDTELADKLFFRLLLWADYLGKKEVRMETLRSEDAYSRRWKFEKHSVIMKFVLPDNYEAEYVKTIRLLKDKKDIPTTEMSLEMEKENE